MRKIQTPPRWVIIAVALVLAAGVVFLVVLVSSNGSEDSGAASGQEASDPPGVPPPGVPGGEGSSGSAGAAGDGAGGGSADGGSGGAGRSAAGGSGSSGDGGGSGGGSGADGGSPPPPSGLCAPAEFLGGLPAFVKALGDPNLLPGWVGPASNHTTGVSDLLSNKILGPLGTVLGTPVTVLSGFNEAYQPLAAEIPDECANLSGDPHILTHDQFRYSFQGVGEYLAMANTDRSVEVQVRTVPLGSGRRASGVGGVAVRIDGTEVVADMTADHLVVVNDEPIDGEQFIETANGGQIMVLDGELGIIWPDGITTVSVTRVGRNTMSMHLAIAPDLAGDVMGLLGDADGDPTNDLVTKDGEPATDDFASLYGAFRESWRVSGPESMFTGPSLYDTTYPEDDVSFGAGPRRSAKFTCVMAGVAPGDRLDDCIYDVLVSGDDSLADAHAAGQRDRVRFHDAGCALDVSGSTSMEGYGPGRSWSTDPIELSGTLDWEFDQNATPWVTRATPTPDGRLFVLDPRRGAHDPLLGAHLMTRQGEIEWTAPVAPIRYVEPLVAGSTGFVATTDGIAAIDLDNGDICWHVVLYRAERVQSFGFVDRTLVAALEGGSVSTILALDAVTGETRWVRYVNPHLDSEATPAITDGAVVVVSSDGTSDHLISALDVASGEMIWQRDSGFRRVVNLAVASGTVYVVGGHGEIMSLDADSGTVRWSVDVLPSGVSYGAAFGAESIVVSHSDGVVSVDVASGTVSWELQANRDLRLTPQGSQPVIAGETVYLYVDRGTQLLGLDVRTGAETIRIDNRGSISPDLSGPPIVLSDGIVLKPGYDWGQVAVYR